MVIPDIFGTDWLRELQGLCLVSDASGIFRNTFRNTPPIQYLGIRSFESGGLTRVISIKEFRLHKVLLLNNLRPELLQLMIRRLQNPKIKSHIGF